MNQKESISKGRFTLGSNLVYQQDLAVELENYLKTKHPDFAGDFEKYFPKSSSLHITLGERMAIRSCLPVTMHRYLQAAGFLTDVPVMEYIHKMWPAFEFEGIKAWSRPKLSRLTREEYGIPIISCGALWLNSPFNDESRRRMIESGYCDNDEQVEQYLRLLHGRTIEQIVAKQPAVITIKSPVGVGLAHSVIGWEIKDDKVIYSNVDARDGGRKILVSRPLTILDDEIASKGAITILF